MWRFDPSIILFLYETMPKIEEIGHMCIIDCLEVIQIEPKMSSISLFTSSYHSYNHRMTFHIIT